MSDTTSIITGHGGGGKKGGAKSMDDTLRSVARAIFIDALSEGPIVGLVDGQNSIYVNRTPLSNIKDSTHQVRLGLPDDDPVEGIDGTEAFQNVGVEVSQTVGSQIRTVLDTELDVVRIYMTLGNLYSISSKGAMRTTNTGWDIDIRPAGGDWTRAVTARLNGEKCTSPVQFQHNIRVKDFGVGPWDIRISAAYPDRTGKKIYEHIQWDGMSLLTEGKFSYPHTALVSLDLSSEHVGGSVPARHYHIKGRLVRVPSNYDPATRQYTGIWDGSFKRAWTDNPAWVYYDIATDRIFGLGNELDEYVTNKWQLYGIAQHCDALVPSGYKDEAGDSIMEPRYTFNGVITDKKDAIEALRSITTVWRGMGFYSASQFHVTMDAPQDVAHIYGPANVIDGRFEYQTSSVKARHTVVMVRFNDPDNLFEPAIEPVIDNEGVHNLGWREKTVELIGCSSRSLARRYGQWILDTEKNETETASFSVGMDSIHALPGEVIAIADPRRAQVRCSGRIAEVADGRHVRLDQAIDDAVSHTNATLYIQGADGTLKTHQNRTISEDGEWIDLGVGNASDDLVGRVFILSASNVAPREYRIVSIDERSDGATYSITALQFDRTKFARIEQGINFAPLPNRVDVSTVNKVRSLVANGRTFTDGGQVRTEITLGWAPPLDTLVREYQITVDTPTAKGVPVATTILNSTSFSSTDPGIYTFHVRTVSFTGQVSDPETATFTAEGAAAISSAMVADLVNATTGLGSGTFVEPDLYLRWKNMVAVSDAPDAEMVEQDPANYSETILRFFTGSTYLGERRVRGNTFTYTLEMNRSDSIAAGLSAPSRSLTVTAYVIDASGALSPPTSITLINNPPAEIIPEVSISGNQIFVSLPKSEDPDHEGYLVWVLKTNGSVVGIPPSAILSGTEYSQFVEEGTDYWVTAASFDAFGINDLNYSMPIEVRSRFDLDRIANEARQGVDDIRDEVSQALDDMTVDYQSAQAAALAAETARDLALGYRDEASLAAGTASTKAGVATQAANDAGDSASAAAGAASTAIAKAGEADQSAQAASASATTASTKASEASTHATQAATSESNAAGSASAAGASAGVAAGAATDAGNSASAASTSATNAAASATTAGQQASAATTAKVAAETAKGQAEASTITAVSAKDAAEGAAVVAVDAATLAATLVDGANSAINQEAIVRADADGALALRADTLEATAGNHGARLDTAENAIATNTSAIASFNQRVSVASEANRIVRDGTFQEAFAEWPGGNLQIPARLITRDPGNTQWWRATMPAERALLIEDFDAGGWIGTGRQPAAPETEFTFGGDVAIRPNSRTARIHLRFYNSAGTLIQNDRIDADPAKAESWQRLIKKVMSPVGTATAECYIIGSGTGTQDTWFTNLFAYSGADAMAVGSLKIEAVVADDDSSATLNLGVIAGNYETGAGEAALRLRASNDGSSEILCSANAFFMFDQENESVPFAYVDGELYLNARVTAEYLTIDKLLTIAPNAGFTYGKASAGDNTDGIYLGVSSNGFGLSASRTKNDRKQRLRLLESSGLELLNARHFVSGTTADTIVTHTANLGKTALPAGISSIQLDMVGGGAGGTRVLSFHSQGGEGSYPTYSPSNPGNPTIVRLYDGATLKHEIVANGGLASDQPDAWRQGKGEDSPWGTGGAQGYTRGGEDPKSEGGTSAGGYGAGGGGPHKYHIGAAYGGSAGDFISTDTYDLSTWADPQIEIVIGTGGVGYSSWPYFNERCYNSGSGSPGRVRYTWSATKNIPADVVPLEAADKGSFEKIHNVAGSFPDLGAGLWVIFTRNNNNLNLGSVTVDDAGSTIYLWDTKNATFFASKTPTFPANANTRTIDYLFYSMGDWG